MNLFICTGRTTKDIELKQSKNGASYCRFSLAVDSGSGKFKKTSFLDFVAYGKTAEYLSQYVTKGMKILIKRAEVVRDDYTDKNGDKHMSYSFSCLEWEFAESKKSVQQNAIPTDDFDFMDTPEGNPFN